MGAVIEIKRPCAATQGNEPDTFSVPHPATGGKVVHLELPQRCPRCRLDRALFRLTGHRARGTLRAENIACECGWTTRVWWR